MGLLWVRKWDNHVIDSTQLLMHNNWFKDSQIFALRLDPSPEHGLKCPPTDWSFLPGNWLVNPAKCDQSQTHHPPPSVSPPSCFSSRVPYLGLWHHDSPMLNLSYLGLVFPQRIHHQMLSLSLHSVSSSPHFHSSCFPSGVPNQTVG